LISVAFGSDWDNVNPPVEMVDVALGSLILLPCDPPLANPTPNVVWLRNEVLLDTTDGSKYKVLPTSGDLIIGDVQANDVNNGGDLHTYQCHVTNKLIYQSMDSPYGYQLNQVG